MRKFPCQTTSYNLGMSAKRVPQPTEKASAMAEAVKTGKRKAARVDTTTATGRKAKKQRQDNRRPTSVLDTDEEIEVSTNANRENSPRMGVEYEPSGGDMSPTGNSKVDKSSDTELGMYLSRRLVSLLTVS